MARTRTRRLARCLPWLGAALAVVACSAGAAEHDGPLRIARFHYPPLLFHPEQADRDVPGYAPELAALAFRRAGREVELVPSPLKRAMAELAVNRIDGIAALNPRDLPGILFARVPVTALHIACFTRHDTDWVYDGPESLRGRVLGTVGGYYYRDADPAFQAYVEAGEDVREVTGPAAQRSLIGMLAAGRIDVFCNDVAHVMYTLGVFYPGTRLRRAGGLVGTIYAYLVVNSQRPDARSLVDTYDENLRALYREGVVRQVLDRYGFFTVPEGEALYARLLERVGR